MKKLEAFIFDFDGVIVLSEPIHHAAVVRAIESLNITMDYETYRQQYVGLSDELIYPKIFQTHGIEYNDEMIRDAIKRKEKFYNALSRELVAENGVMELANQAKRLKLKLGICTASRRSDLFSVLPYLNGGELVHYFDAIVTSEEMTAGKSTPEGYLLTAKKLGVKPENCLVVEDSPVGIRSAKGAGMTVIGITTSYSFDLLKTSPADKIITNLKEINLSNYVRVC